MHKFKFGFLLLTAGVLVSAFGGCAPAPYTNEIVVLVPCPDKNWPPNDWPPPAWPPPPITVTAPVTPRTTPLDSNQDTPVVNTKTRERMPTPTLGRTRTR